MSTVQALMETSGAIKPTISRIVMLSTYQDTPMANHLIA